MQESSQNSQQKMKIRNNFISSNNDLEQNELDISEEEEKESIKEERRENKKIPTESPEKIMPIHTRHISLQKIPEMPQNLQKENLKLVKHSSHRNTVNERPGSPQKSFRIIVEDLSEDIANTDNMNSIFTPSSRNDGTYTKKSEYEFVIPKRRFSYKQEENLEFNSDYKLEPDERKRNSKKNQITPVEHYLAKCEDDESIEPKVKTMKSWNKEKAIFLMKRGDSLTEKAHFTSSKGNLPSRANSSFEDDESDLEKKDGISINPASGFNRFHNWIFPHNRLLNYRNIQELQDMIKETDFRIDMQALFDWHSKSCFQLTLRKMVL